MTMNAEFQVTAEQFKAVMDGELEAKRARVAELEAALQDGLVGRREDYFPEVAQLRRRNREMHDRAQRAEVERDRLRKVIEDILDEATWDEEEHDGEEPDEDDMCEALSTIHCYAAVALREGAP